MAAPKVSIIIPVYNVEKYLNKCLGSLVSQSYKNIEIIVVNDGTKDNSQDIIDRYKVEYPNLIQNFTKQNGGLSDARNFGLSKSSGEYIYFVDSDDWIEPNLIEECIKKISDNDILSFDYFNDSYNEDEVQVNSVVKILPEDFKGEQILEIAGYAWNKMYKRSFLIENKLEFDISLKVYEDIDFNLRCFIKTDKVKIYNKPLYHYINRHAPSLIKSYDAKRIQNFNTNQKTLKEYLNVAVLDKNLAVKIQASFLMNCIRYQFYSLYNFAKLTFKVRNEMIKQLFSEIDNFDLIKHYHPNNLKDHIIKNLVSSKAVVILNILFSLTK